MKNRSVFKRRKGAIKNGSSEENKVIVEDLLKGLREKALEHFNNNIEILVKSLNTSPASVDSQYEPKSHSYYTIHFETIHLNCISSEADDPVIYIGLGLDLNMQKSVLGFWLKKSSEHPYKFWLDVCEQIKSSGVRFVEVKHYNDQYWLNEAMNKVFQD